MSGISMNPNMLAQKYAKMKNISMEEAQAQMQGQFGTPNLQNQSIFSVDKPQNQNNFDISSLNPNNMQGMLPPQQDMSGIGMMDKIMNFFRGGSGQEQAGAPRELTFIQDGPQKQGDPQMFKPEDMMAQGPQKPGDPQFIPEEMLGQGPQKVGDPQMFNPENMKAQGMNEMQKFGNPQMLGFNNQEDMMPRGQNMFAMEGPQKPGDPQMPRLEGAEKRGNSQMGQNSEQGQMDPEAYAAKYAEQNNISIEEAREELKKKYGNPQQMQQM